MTKDEATKTMIAIHAACDELGFEDSPRVFIRNEYGVYKFSETLEDAQQYQQDSANYWLVYMYVVDQPKYALKDKYRLYYRFSTYDNIKEKIAAVFASPMMTAMIEQ